MNRVYKVIWSKAKHCYVVTSEIARSVTKSASSARSAGRKGAAVLAMAALLFTAGGVLGEAANVTEIAVNKRGNVITATKDVGKPTSITIDNVDHAKRAVKATKDGDGNVISTTYAKVDAEGKVAKAVAADSAEQATKDGKGNEISSTYATKEDVKTYYVQKAEAQVTNLYASGDVKAGSTLNVGDGKFIVDIAGMTTTGDLTVKGDTEMKGNLGVNGNIKTNRGFIQTGGGNINTQGGALRTNGGNINAGDGLIQTTGTVKAGKVQTGTLKTTGKATIGGALTVKGDTEMEGTLKAGATTVDSLDAGGGLIQTTGTVKAGKVQTGTLKTIGKATIGGALTVKGDTKMKGNLSVKGEFKSETLSSELDKNNYTTINGGKTQSVNLKVDAVGTETQASASTFDENGSNAWAKDDDSIGKSSMTADKISQSLSDKGDNPKNAASRVLSQIADNKYEIADSVVDANGNTNTSTQLSDRTITNIKNGTNESIDLQEVDQIGSSVTDGTNTTVVSQNAGSLISSITDKANNTSTGVTQTATDITNTANNGTIANEAKDITNHATENMTNTVGGNLTTTVTGDSSLTAENITNEAKNKITNKARDVETDAASSIVSKVSNAAGSNTSTQLSYQTMEEMSQADGKTASYLRGAVEEKSQLIDGDKKTTIDTIAGQTNTNITEGKNVSNSLQKADQIASSVTDGTNTTVVNQDAVSLASSITDGTKVNNTKNTVDKSEQLIKVDDTHFYAEIRTAGNAVEALKSDGNTIISAKDAVTGTVSSAVTDGATITGISQNAKDISLSAAGGTITNDANDVLNKGANSVINKVGDNKVAVKTDRVKVAYGSDTYTTWNDKGITSKTGGNMSNSATNITNTATEKLSNSAADIKNSATESITDKVGENVKRTMTTNKISESVKDDAKSNSFSKTAERDINIITDGTKTSTESQLADSVNTSLKEVDGTGNTTKSLNNVKTVSEDTTKMTDAASGAFSKRSQTVSQIQDKVGKTTVTTIDGKTTLTDEDHNHTTEMDYANVTKDLSVYRNTTLGEEGEDTILTVNSTSTFKDTVKMEKTLEVDGESTFNNKVTITKGGLDVKGGTTTDTLTVTGTSEFRGKADFKDNVSMGKGLAVAGETKTGTLHVEKDGYVGGNLNVAGNIETHDAVLSADSRQVVTGRQLYQTNERVDRLDNRIKKVGANAAALAALRPGDFNPDDKFSIAAGFGSYRNANAAALGLFYRPNENVLLSLGTSFGDGENMVNAGVSVKFGRGKSMAERRKEMADEVSSMRDEMRSQDERIAELEEMLKKQSELIEKLSKES